MTKRSKDIQEWKFSYNEFYLASSDAKRRGNGRAEQLLGPSGVGTPRRVTLRQHPNLTVTRWWPTNHTCRCQSGHVR